MVVSHWENDLNPGRYQNVAVHVNVKGVCCTVGLLSRHRRIGLTVSYNVYLVLLSAGIC